MSTPEPFQQSCGCICDMPYGRVRSCCAAGNRLRKELNAAPLHFSSPQYKVALTNWINHFKELSAELRRRDPEPPNDKEAE